MKEPAKLPVKVDIGLSAKAEIKAEIPSSSAGKLIDALTDSLRPFTEKRGLKADEIRLQREDVLLQIAQKAKLRAEVEQAPIKPIPLRFLVPLLEKASWTDFGDEELTNMWANLLFSAGIGLADEKILLIDIIGKISSKDAALFDEICLRPITEKGNPNKLEDSSMYERTVAGIDLANLVSEKKPWHVICAKLLLEHEAHGCAISKVLVLNSEWGNEEFLYVKNGSNSFELDGTIQRLKLLGLVETHDHSKSFYGHQFFIETVSVSRLGADFFNATHNVGAFVAKRMKSSSSVGSENSIYSSIYVDALSNLLNFDGFKNAIKVNEPLDRKTR